MRSALLLLLGLAACDQSPVHWKDPVVITRAATPTRLVLVGDSARFVPAPPREAAPPLSPGMCPRSVKTAQGARHLFAVWWQVRSDSSAELLSAASPDSGRTWGLPVPVDTSDISSRGCDRPSPSITTVDDDMHVAYSMTAPEGTGVFFAHFMSGMLHSPVAVIYGDHLVATAIAGDGDRIAVAYEDPNGKRQQVKVAYSPTQGHIFDWRTTASRDIDGATAPAVALDGSSLAVGWTSQKFDQGAGAEVVRVGRIK